MNMPASCAALRFPARSASGAHKWARARTMSLPAASLRDTMWVLEPEPRAGPLVTLPLTQQSSTNLLCAACGATWSPARPPHLCCVRASRECAQRKSAHQLTQRGPREPPERLTTVQEIGHQTGYTPAFGRPTPDVANDATKSVEPAPCLVEPNPALIAPPPPTRSNPTQTWWNPSKIWRHLKFGNFVETTATSAHAHPKHGQAHPNLVKPTPVGSS